MKFRPSITEGPPADFAVPPIAGAERPEVLRGPRRDFTEQAQNDAAAYRLVLVRYYCSMKRVVSSAVDDFDRGPLNRARPVVVGEYNAARDEMHYGR
jgi:hypothetical protein